jgi:hypothetical protein
MGMVQHKSGWLVASAFWSANILFLHSFALKIKVVAIAGVFSTAH